MSADRCEWQSEVLEIARSGGWPDRADDGLLAHVAACVTCGDLVAVAAAIAADCAAAVSHAVVPPSGAVWWRMQRRKRLEAENSARRIITALQGASIAAGVIAVALLLPSLWSGSFAGLLGGAFDLVRGTVSSLALPLVIAGVTVLAAMPVALVLALRE